MDANQLVLHAQEVRALRIARPFGIKISPGLSFKRLDESTLISIWRAGHAGPTVYH